jgi:hypothetical protein
LHDPLLYATFTAAPRNWIGLILVIAWKLRWKAEALGSPAHITCGGSHELQNRGDLGRPLTSQLAVPGWR